MNINDWLLHVDAIVAKAKQSAYKFRKSKGMGTGYRRRLLQLCCEAHSYHKLRLLSPISFIKVSLKLMRAIPKKYRAFGLRLLRNPINFHISSEYLQLQATKFTNVLEEMGQKYPTEIAELRAHAEAICTLQGQVNPEEVWVSIRNDPSASALFAMVDKRIMGAVWKEADADWRWLAPSKTGSHTRTHGVWVKAGDPRLNQTTCPSCHHSW